MNKPFKNLINLMLVQAERRKNFIDAQKLQIPLDIKKYHADVEKIEKQEDKQERKCLKYL